MPTGQRDLAMPTWMRDAACRGSALTLFFPERGESADPARAICAGCPVVEDCLLWALERNERYGVLGGMTEQERHQLTRRPRRATRPRCGTIAGYAWHYRYRERVCEPCRTVANQRRSEVRRRASVA